jgi:hypothetical protein
MILEVMQRRMVPIAVITVLLTSTVFAGAIFEINCPDAKCGFKSELHLGGVLMYERAAGYCTTCNDFVFVSWRRPGRGGGPTSQPVAGEIWDGASGRMIRLFHCRKCNTLFGEIKSIDELKHCPRCSGPLPTTKPVAVED